MSCATCTAMTFKERTSCDVLVYDADERNPKRALYTNAAPGLIVTKTRTCAASVYQSSTALSRGLMRLSGSGSATGSQKFPSRSTRRFSFCGYEKPTSRTSFEASGSASISGKYAALAKSLCHNQLASPPGTPSPGVSRSSPGSLGGLQGGAANTEASGQSTGLEGRELGSGPVERSSKRAVTMCGGLRPWTAGLEDSRLKANGRLVHKHSLDYTAELLDSEHVDQDSSIVWQPTNQFGSSQGANITGSAQPASSSRGVHGASQSSLCSQQGSGAIGAKDTNRLAAPIPIPSTAAANSSSSLASGVNRVEDRLSNPSFSQRATAMVSDVLQTPLQTTVDDGHPTERSSFPSLGLTTMTFSPLEHQPTPPSSAPSTPSPWPKPTLLVEAGVYRNLKSASMPLPTTKLLGHVAPTTPHDPLGGWLCRSRAYRAAKKIVDKATPPAMLALIRTSCKSQPEQQQQQQATVLQPTPPEYPPMPDSPGSPGSFRSESRQYKPILLNSTARSLRSKSELRVSFSDRIRPSWVAEEL